MGNRIKEFRRCHGWGTVPDRQYSGGEFFAQRPCIALVPPAREAAGHLLLEVVIFGVDDEAGGNRREASVSRSEEDTARPLACILRALGEVAKIGHVPCCVLDAGDCALAILGPQ